MWGRCRCSLKRHKEGDGVDRTVQGRSDRNGMLGTQVHAPALSPRVCACLHNPVAIRAKINTSSQTNRDMVEYDMSS